MELYYNIAGIGICITGKDDELCLKQWRLEPFQSEKKDLYYKYHFYIVDDLDKESGNCIYRSSSKRIYKDGNRTIQYIGVVGDSISESYSRCEIQGKEAEVQIKREKILGQITGKVVLNSIGIESLLLKEDAFILHSSYINVDGKAILFTAPSGTGKSSQAELWKELRGAEIINGDRAVIQVKDDNVLACGVPFSGSSEYCENAILPIEAIVCLDQASVTSLKKLNAADAFRKIWEQITIPVWDNGAVEKISEKISVLLKKVPMYHLACTLDESAVIALENVLNEE